MNNKTKLNIKATIILIIYISIGIIVANFFQVEFKPRDGFQTILSFVIGFIIGLGGSILLAILWGLIRDFFED